MPLSIQAPICESRLLPRTYQIRPMSYSYMVSIMAATAIADSAITVPSTTKPTRRRARTPSASESNASGGAERGASGSRALGEASGSMLASWRHGDEPMGADPLAGGRHGGVVAATGALASGGALQRAWLAGRSVEAASVPSSAGLAGGGVLEAGGALEW